LDSFCLYRRFFSTFHVWCGDLWAINRVDLFAHFNYSLFRYSTQWHCTNGDRKGEYWAGISNANNWVLSKTYRSCIEVSTHSYFTHSVYTPSGIQMLQFTLLRIICHGSLFGKSFWEELFLFLGYKNSIHWQHSNESAIG
jgi:hypothetical protein